MNSLVALIQYTRRQSCLLISHFRFPLSGLSFQFSAFPPWSVVRGPWSDFRFPNSSFSVWLSRL
jgi:hypothetical protein